MKTRLLLSLLACLWAGLAAWGQDEQKPRLTVTTYAVDEITHEGLDTATVVLLTAADSCLVDSGKCVVYRWGEDSWCILSIRVDKVDNYLLKVQSFGYEDRYIPLRIDRFYKRERTRELKRVAMRRQNKVTETLMDAVTVRATKIKFYMNGDTLTYNADMFDLAEGSMLDALIKKMPGVELKSGGEITVNGEKVDALLLNGKDFFNSDRELILDNLPAYMVKNVQIYDRKPKEYENSRRGDNEKREKVLNVRLKKEYQGGWIANLRGGGGLPLYRESDNVLTDEKTPTRFVGRLFAMHFDEKSRISLYANANNLNDDRQPGEDEEWTPDQQPTGLLTSYSAGVDGNYEKALDRTTLEYRGGAHGEYSSSDDRSTSTTTTFLEGGNTYGKDYSGSTGQNIAVHTDHEVSFRSDQELPWAKNFYASVSPSFSYQHSDNASQSASVTLSQDVASGLGKAWLDSIMAPKAGDLLRQYALNRNITEAQGNGHSTNASVSLMAHWSPPHDDSKEVSLRGSYSFAENESEHFDHDLIDYPASSQASDFRNRYRPNESVSHAASGEVSYSMALGAQSDHWLEAEYGVDYNYNRSDNPLYLLHQLQGYGQECPLGELPSVTEMLSTLDRNNSSWTTQRDLTQTPSLGYRWHGQDDSTRVFQQFSATLRLPIQDEHTDYRKGSVDTLLTRRTAFLTPSVMYFLSNQQRGLHIWAYYGMTTSSPEITNLVSLCDDSNPLYISHTNPNLRNTRNHNFSVSYHDKWQRTMFHTSLSGNITQDRVAMSSIYDKTTGVRTVMPENVDGNWNARAEVGVDIPLLKGDEMRLSHEVDYSFTNSVDLNGTSATGVATRSVVKSHNIDYTLKYSWEPTSKMEFGAKGDLHYQGSTSSREDFETLHVFDFDYGLTAKVELPWNMQLATDLTMYQRRGYSDQTMNTNELVWNARLTKRMCKGKLMIQLDGFDLLGNLSSVHRSINAQGKAETYYNVIPSYALLHLVWKFSKRPKKVRG